MMMTRTSPCRNKDASPCKDLNKEEGAIKSVGSEVGVAVKRFPVKGRRERGRSGKRLGGKQVYTQ